MGSDTVNLLRKNDFFTPRYAEVILPKDPMDVLPWIDENYYIPKEASSEPGKFDVSRVPYVRGLSKFLNDKNVEEIYIQKGSQLGITEFALAYCAYIVCEDPKTIFYLLPIESMAKKVSNQRIGPMIDANPLVKAKIRAKGEDGKKRTSNTENILSKSFPGGLWVITYSNSSAALKSLPVQLAILDEIDEYPSDLNDQGEVIDIVRARFQAQRYKKIMAFSTPTVEGDSRIDELVKATRIHCYFVPCPLCGVMDHFRFDDFSWEEGKPETVKWICPSCQGSVEEAKKPWMMERGEWRPTTTASSNERANQGRIIGCHLPSFYAPYGWVSWEDIAHQWEEYKRTNSEEKLKAFNNHLLGQVWTPQVGAIPDFETLYLRRGECERNKIKEGFTVITCGVDVQGDYLAVEIVAWKGDGSYQSQSIDYREIMGDTTVHTNDCWRTLAEILQEKFEVEGTGKKLRINAMAVDSSYRTQTVYSWCRKFKASGRVFPIKGTDADVPLGTAKNLDAKKKNGKKSRSGNRVQMVGVNILKAELYGWLQQQLPENSDQLPAGWATFPKYDKGYFEMLTAEKQVLRKSTGATKKKLVWEKIRDRNEVLDCRIYSRAAYILKGFENYREEAWKRYNKKIFLTGKTKTATKEAPKSVWDNE